MEKTIAVIAGLAAVNRDWDELLPLLDEMQSFLSQRGESRDKLRAADLPGWGDWFKSYKQDTGLNVTLRAVQKRLASFRAKGAKSRKKPYPVPHLSVKNQRRLLKAQQFANEMVAAIDNGANYAEPVKLYKQIAMDSRELNGLLQQNENVALAQTVAHASFAQGNSPWKRVLIELTNTLEQYGQRLPVPVLIHLRLIKQLLGKQPNQQAVPSRTISNGHLPKREAESVCHSLNMSPVATIRESA
jgi:hypothetical protein